MVNFSIGSSRQSECWFIFFSIKNYNLCSCHKLWVFCKCQLLYWLFSSFSLVNLLTPSIRMSLVHFPSLGVTKKSLAFSQTGTVLLIKPAGEANNLSHLTTPKHKEHGKSIHGNVLSLIPPAERKGQHRARCLLANWARVRSPSYLLLTRKEMCEILRKTQGRGGGGEEN